MKKLLNFLILALLLAAVPQAEATTFLVKLDNASGITVRGANLSTSIGLSTGTTNYSVPAGLTEQNLSKNIIGVKGASAVYVNGSKVTDSRSSFYYFSSGDYSNGALLEIYKTSDAVKYEYPLTLSIDDEFGHIKKIVASDGREWTPFSTSSSDQFPSSVNYTFGTQFTVYTDKQPNAEDYSISKYKAGGNIIEFKDKDGYAYAYTFIPAPTLNGCTFSMKIDESLRAIPFTTTIVTPKYVIGFQINHNATGEENSVEDLMPLVSEAISNMGSGDTSISVNSTFHAGDTYTIYSTEIAASVSMESSPIAYTNATYNGQACYAYTFTPAEGCTARAAFIDQFVVTFNADVANQIVAKIYNSASELINSVILASGDNSVKCPSDGNIVVELLPNAECLYTKFECTGYVRSTINTQMKKEQTVDWLGEDPPTDLPVTLRAQLTVSYDDNTYMKIEECGTFYIKTRSTTTLQWYSLNITVDDPSKVNVVVGRNPSPTASSSRAITGFRPGEAINVAYSEIDKYVVVSPSGLNTLYQVIADKGTVDTTEAESSSIFRYPLSDATDGANLEVEANRPISPGSSSFTFNIDHPEYMVSLNRQIDWVNYPVGGIHQGANTVTFDEGEQFLLQTDADYKPTVTMNGTPIDDYYNRFTFTPTNNATVNVVYGNITLPTFTLATDNPMNVEKVEREERGKTYTITEDFTTIPFVAGDEVKVRVYTNPSQAYWLSADNVRTNLSFESLTCTFTPTEGGTLYLVYQTVPVFIPKFTFNVDDASQITRIWDYSTGDDYTDDLVDGENLIPVGDGALYVTVADKATRFTVDGEDATYNVSRKRYTIEVGQDSYVNVVFAKDPKLTITTDVPSKFNAFNNTSSGDNLLPILTFGTSTYDFTRGQSFSFTLAEAPLAVTLNGEALSPASGNTYNFTPGDADELKVFFNYVPDDGKLYTVKVEMANAGSEGAFIYGYVKETVALSSECMMSGILVKEGDNVQVSCNTNQYVVNGISVNGAAVNLSNFKGAYNFNVYENSTITIDARIIEVYNFTIHTTAKDNLLIYSGVAATPESTFALTYPTDANDQPIVTNEFALSTTEFASQIHIRPVGEIIISGITDGDNNDYTAVNREFTIDVTDGMDIYITTAAVTYDKTMMVKIYVEEGTSGWHWDDGCGSIITEGGRNISLNPGINVVNFSEEFDGTFKYSINPRPAELHTMVEGVEVAPDPATLDMFYVFTPTEGTVVRSFYEYSTERGTESYFEPLLDDDGEQMYDDDGEPLGEWKERETDLVVNVPFTEYEIKYNVDKEIAADMLFMRDDYEVIDFSKASVNEYKGTIIYVYIKEESNVALYINRGPSRLASMREPLRADAAPHPAPAGYKYVSSVLVNTPVNFVAEKSDITTGVEGVEAAAPAAINAIYNLQGICIKPEATADDLHSLPAGVYIYNGKKILVK